jgi:hypothetical protein
MEVRSGEGVRHTNSQEVQRFNYNPAREAARERHIDLVTHHDMKRGNGYAPRPRPHTLRQAAPPICILLFLRL